jgi:hypothetical protein
MTPSARPSSLHPVEDRLAVDLSAVIVAVVAGQPLVRIVPGEALPSGPLGETHPTLEQGLRAWVKAQSGLDLGYVEQLYTFADRNRGQGGGPPNVRRISISYLALVPRDESHAGPDDPSWSPWYRYFPWEDRRGKTPNTLLTSLRPALKAWRDAAPTDNARDHRAERLAVAFPKDPKAWNAEMVLQRYELLWEAGLVDEGRGERAESSNLSPQLGVAMAHDHRRILATAMARLRAKITYRPVVFELIPERFTLLTLQTTVEALAGMTLHKQNFRRLVVDQGLVEPLPEQNHPDRGRPARLFAFRRQVLRERAVAGTKLPRSG